MKSGLGPNKGRQAARSALIHGFVTHLPDFSQPKTPGKIQKKLIYSKPQPLSAHIRQVKTASPSFKGSFVKEKKSVYSNDWANITPFRSKAQRRRKYLEINNLEMPEDEFDIEGNKDLSHIVFPTHTTVDNSSVLSNKSFSSSHLDTSLGNEKTLFRKDVTVMLDTLLHKYKSNLDPGEKSNDPSKDISTKLSSEVMELLKTPNVVKRRPSLLRKSNVESPFIDTPQSILKVKKIIQRPMSPSACSDISSSQNNNTINNIIVKLPPQTFQGILIFAFIEIYL